jgi:hypothetical protein
VTAVLLSISFLLLGHHSRVGVDHTYEQIIGEGFFGDLFLIIENYLIDLKSRIG